MSSSPATLLIDDNEDDVFFMAQAVKAAGIKSPLYVVRDGREALAYLKGEGKFADRFTFPLPGLIFLDLKLPYVTGLTVLEWLREQLQFEKVVVIVLTSSQAPVDLNRAFQIGANSVLEKPPTAEKILELARTFRLRGYLEENKPT